MRSLVVLAAVGFLTLIAVARPQIGLYAWGWLTLMQPHQIVWGLDSLRLNLVIALVTFIAWLFSKEPKLPPLERTSVLIYLFVAWMVVCQSTSLRPESSWVYFDRSIRVMAFTIICSILLNTKARIHAMVWIICISIGYFGVIGGIFTLVTGGGYRVWGPPQTIISDNNHLGAALVFVLPLLIYLKTVSENIWIKRGVLLTVALTCISILGTQSRGAFLALLPVILWFWWSSRNRFASIFVIALISGIGFEFMPDTWHERMATIGKAGQDLSFMGRIEAWTVSIHAALAHPFTGVGFRVTYLPDVMATFGLPSERPRATHSIYFEILGSMGFVGLAIFLTIIAISFLNARSIMQICRQTPGCKWAYEFASMAQISLIGFCVGGAALSLEFWDGAWLLFAMLAQVRCQSAKSSEIEDVQGGNRPTKSSAIS